MELHKMSALIELFRQAGVTVPEALSNWDDRVGAWCLDYANRHSGAEISEMNLDFAVFLFDHRAERVTLAYALSVRQLMKRDAGRTRGFPDVNANGQVTPASKMFVADKGHFLGHASGGILDINLFPHRRELNQGRSPEGRRFRSMERHVAEHPGTFFYHRPSYNDETWIPQYLEYGVLIDDTRWWVDTFRNK